MLLSMCTTLYIINWHDWRELNVILDSHGEIVIVVNVQDENDNPPLFNGGQQVMTIGIPDTTNTGDFITTLRVWDKINIEFLSFNI